MNKKGQFDNPIIVFAVIVVALILLAPIGLKIFRSIATPTAAALGNVSSGGEIAQTNFNAVMNPLITFWDKAIIIVFVALVLLLFVSAFFIDANPFWVVLYILSNFFLILFAPSIMTAADKIYESAAFAQEVAYLTFLDSLRTNYPIFLVGMMVITGIIIYGKVAIFGRNNTGRSR